MDSKRRVIYAPRVVLMDQKERMEWRNGFLVFRACAG